MELQAQNVGFDRGDKEQPFQGVTEAARSGVS